MLRPFLRPVAIRRHLEAGHRARRGPEGGPGGVVDGDGLGAVGARALRHEGVQVAAGRRSTSLAEQELHLVDHVRAEVAERTRAGASRGAAATSSGADVVGQPVLEVGRRAPGAPSPIRPARDQLAGQRQRRHPAVVEADHRVHAALARRSRPRRPSPRPRRRCWPAASRPARACRPRARRSRSRRAGGRGCRCRRCRCRRARSPRASRWRTRPSRSWRGGLLDRAARRGRPAPAGDAGGVGVEGADVAPGVGVGLAHEGVADDGDPRAGGWPVQRSCVPGRRLGEGPQERQAVAGQVVLGEAASGRQMEAAMAMEALSAVKLSMLSGPA